MTTINEAKRLVKRAILSNIVSDKKNLAITPLVSGKHGIGKSAMIKSIADDLDGVCITVEGGTLKEGEITGLPYQYKDENGEIRFRFLPYYAIERIQKEERRIFEMLNKDKAKGSYLLGEENQYSMNDISWQKKIEMFKNKTVKPVIIFIDEINRTENSVYKELMNILLTRSVNGYNFPWWVFFVGAMNPSTQSSIYATNEMDPAQLDRFIKIKVNENTNEWLKYGQENDISESIINFIKDNPKCLSVDSRQLQDEEKPSPSPRGWDMIDTLIKAEPLLRDFFNEKENSLKVVESDFKALISAKVGPTVATMYFASLVSKQRPLDPEELFSDDEKLSESLPKLKRMNDAKKIQTCDLLVTYLKNNVEFFMIDKKGFEKKKKQLTVFIKALDASTKLLFAQNIAETKVSGNKSLIEFVFDIFEKELIGVLDLSDEIRKKIIGSN